MLQQCKDVLTVSELAETLGVGRNTAYRMVRDGVIASRRVGRKYLVPKVCVVDYLDGTRYNCPRNGGQF